MTETVRASRGVIYPLIKRGIDLASAALLLILLSPLLIVLWLAVRIFLGSPALFSQVRPGLGGRPFRMIKFRSMINALDAQGGLLPDEQRLTAFGRFLRASSLDELPELWNVLTGDMSIVGPRPLLMEYLPLFSSEQARRHEVRPGITGWAQINGRNAIEWSEKFKLDVWYVDNVSLLLDVRIMIGTLSRIVDRRGVNHSDRETMPRFGGNK